MPHIRISETVPFTAKQMYGLVVDVERYPEFLPWCKQTRIFDRQPDRFMAEMVIAFKGIRESFQTLDLLEPDRKVEINMRAGPFQYLVSTWTFVPIDQATKVEFFIDFKFRSRMKEIIMGPVFTQVSKQMITAFRRRAVALFGKPLGG